MKCFHPSKLFSAAVKGRSLISMKAVYPTIAPCNRRAWDRKHQIPGNLWWNWEPLPISITQNVTEQHIQHLIWSILWVPVKYPPTCPFQQPPTISSLGRISPFLQSFVSLFYPLCRDKFSKYKWSDPHRAIKKQILQQLFPLWQLVCKCFTGFTV